MRHSRLLPALFFAFLCTSALAQNGIRFEQGTWAEALAKAEKENKMVFMDAYTEWCGPCKLMSRNVFTDSAVGAFFNAQFINYKLDMEKGEGPQLAKLYQVQAYPTLGFFDGRGKLIDKRAGYMDPEAFISLGKRVSEGGYETIAQMRQRFEAGERDPDFLNKYLISSFEAGEIPKEALAAYAPYIEGDALVQKKNWEVFERMIYDWRNPSARYALTHVEQLAATLGPETISRKLNELLVVAIWDADYDGQTTTRDSLMDALENLGLPGSAGAAQLIPVQSLAAQKKWPEALAAGEKLFSMPENGISSDDWNDLAWKVFEECEEQSQLETALKWIDHSISLQESSFNQDTRAWILYKLGRKEESQRAAERAIALAKLEGEDDSETQKLVRKLKR